jgi:hypothetical protein
LRQCSSRDSFRAGRNLPDKEFRYLRTVIVTAAVHRGLDSWLRTPLLVTFRHWAGVSPYTSAYALAETYVFGKQSLEPIFCDLVPILLSPARQVPRHPFFQRYGVNLPSSLTEGHSITWGGFSQPTSVGVRYGQSKHLGSGFSWRPGSRWLPSSYEDSCPSSCLSRGGFASLAHSERAAQPVHSLGPPSLPRPHLPHNGVLWFRNMRLISIAYGLYALGLGPD